MYSVGPNTLESNIWNTSKCHAEIAHVVLLNPNHETGKLVSHDMYSRYVVNDEPILALYCELTIKVDRISGHLQLQVVVNNFCKHVNISLSEFFICLKPMYILVNSENKEKKISDHGFSTFVYYRKL